MIPVAPSNDMCRLRPNKSAAFALAEVVVGMALIIVVLALLFTLNGQLLGLLRQGKHSTYATQLIAERVEQLRTAAWEAVTIPANLEGALKFGSINGSATATGSNLPGVTEIIEIEPYDNPAGDKIGCVRTPAGVQPATGTGFPNETLVKVKISLKWKSGKRDRERQFVTVMSRYRS
jgi:hypothetical protein